MTTLFSILELHQSGLYNRAKEVILPDLQKQMNEHDLTRLAEERVKSEGLSSQYVRIMIWLVGYGDFKDTKEHHKASRTRQENAVELADWLVDSWHEDEKERSHMLLGLSLASPDLRLRAGLILFELGGLPSEKVD